MGIKDIEEKRIPREAYVEQFRGYCKYLEARDGRIPPVMSETLEFLEREGWHKTSENPPTKSDVYLCANEKTKGKNPSFLLMFQKRTVRGKEVWRWENYYTGNIYQGEPAYWMPLPDGPEIWEG